MPEPAAADDRDHENRAAEGREQERERCSSQLSKSSMNAPRARPPSRSREAVQIRRHRRLERVELQGDELSRADESALYHHYELNYTPPDTESGRRLARR
jgi:hypothetical protein